MSTAREERQSAAERKSAEARLREIASRFPPEHQRLAGAMRRWLRKLLPAAHELVYDYPDALVISWSPSEKGYEGVLVIRVGVTDVRLCFNRGRELADPENLLQGTGTQVRWIPVESARTLARPAVVRLVDQALALNPVPFARSGRGPLVFRSESGKERRPRRPARAKSAARKGPARARRGKVSARTGE